jgi:hypothetical protein
MVRNLKTAAVILAVLFTATATVSAQEKKQVEKKVTIVTVDDKGIKTDTIIITHDTIDLEGDEFVFETKDGQVIHGTGEGGKMIFIEKETGGPGMPAQMEMSHMRQMAPGQEGISYHITVDGVTVYIRAPKEKAKEADLILTEVKKVLLKK